MDKRKQTTRAMTITDYSSEFENYPWTEFLLKYRDIESRIISDSIILLNSLLNDYGYTSNHGIFTRQNHHFALNYQLLEHNRTLLVELRPLYHPKKMNTLCSQLNEFGVVREVILLVPDFLASRADVLLEKILLQFRVAYLSLERAFVRCGSELAEEIFKHLYDILNTALEVRERPDLVGRAWFFVAESTIGFYFVDDVQLQKVITHFKIHQHPRFSPIELTAMLLTSPLPFQQSLAIEAWRQQKILDLPWSKAKYISDAPDIYEAELALYKSDCYTATTLVKLNDYFLVLAFPTDIKKDLLPVIESNLDKFKRQFAVGMKFWSPYIHRIKRLIRPVEYQTIAATIGAFLGSFCRETTR